MRGAIRSALVGACAICAFAMPVDQASSATLEAETSPFLAVYGNPPSATPAGYGLARSFGFGTNLLFEATSTAPKAVFQITVGGLTYAGEDVFLGATVTSDKTGADNPLGLAIDFADVSRFSAAGTAIEMFSDTQDRPWLTTICSPSSTTCKVDPLVSAVAGEVQINDVSLNLGPGVVFQGTMWGVWKNGTATEPPCIKLGLPPTGASANQTLTITETAIAFPAVGSRISAISGTACLVSAGNAFYSGHTPAVTIANT